jgi:hypothetical protein
MRADAQIDKPALPVKADLLAGISPMYSAL